MRASQIGFGGEEGIPVPFGKLRQLSLWDSGNLFNGRVAQHSLDVGNSTEESLGNVLSGKASWSRSRVIPVMALCMYIHTIHISEDENLPT